MAEDFLLFEDNTDGTSNSKEMQFSRERIKHLLIGSPKLVTQTIHRLHTLGYAEAVAWSKLQAAGNSGESGGVISVLIKHSVSDG